MQSYQALHMIGEGSFGCVFLVRDKKGESFALKKIKVDPFQVEQALLQIKLMKKFTHPHLVKVYQYHFEEDEEEMQIIMEYCEEGDLSHYQFEKKTLPPQEILQIFRQILTAFLIMSAQGVIHRDLKPQNILLGKGRVVKIGDFGCARMVGAVDMSRADNFSLDKGTFLYASPEQLRNENYSSKCDVWAAGCIAYLLAFGVHPFLDSKPHNTLLLIKKHTEGKEMEIPAGTDPTLAKFISLCLVYEDKERASWREIWLSRVFSPKVKGTDLRKFIDYLRQVSSIASWITKQFWKIRKEFSISKNSDEIFIYFIIKFQWTVLKMALKIIKKSENYHYLFAPEALAQFAPNQDLFNQVKKVYLQHQKYFLSIKKAMEGKESYAEIAARESKRGGCFSDLEKSIRPCYKILTEVKDLLPTHPNGNNKVWTALSHWINFETWLAFERQPKLETFIEETANIGAVVSEELKRYDSGMVE